MTYCKTVKKKKIKKDTSLRNTWREITSTLLSSPSEVLGSTILSGINKEEDI